MASLTNFIADIMAEAGFDVSVAADQTHEAAKPNSTLHNSTLITDRLIFPSLSTVAQTQLRYTTASEGLSRKKLRLRSCAEFRRLPLTALPPLLDDAGAFVNVIIPTHPFTRFGRYEDFKPAIDDRKKVAGGATL